MAVGVGSKRVRFDSGCVYIIPRGNDRLGDVEVTYSDNAYDELCRKRKREFWYSREDLASSRSEAKQIIRMIHAVGGDLDKIDHSSVCVIGVEKFHRGHENEKCRRLLIRSILVRQQLNKSNSVDIRDAEQSLCDISELLSKSFVEYAKWQGSLNAVHAYGTVQPKAALSVQSLLLPVGLGSNLAPMNNHTLLLSSSPGQLVSTTPVNTSEKASLRPTKRQRQSIAAFC